MPSSFICIESEVKREFHVGNFSAYWLRPRPRTFRSVGTSGTRGTGWGIAGVARLEAHRSWQVLTVDTRGAIELRDGIRS
ncbi:hypothetical protein HYQ46_012818 [Verticillium longisporum]|nr:hypothetical protein HYQ46_012818 [Verticillium longisporum]